MKTLIVDEKYNNKKLIRFILDSFANLPLNEFYKALRKKDIKLNGARIHENIVLHTGNCIDIYISDDILYQSSKDSNVSINIVYQDNEILLANKPSGIEVVGENSFTTQLIKNSNLDMLFACHRLDRNTSGLVLFAKSENSLSILLDKFKKGEIEKHYLCHVYGIPTKSTQTLSAYLFKDSKKSLVYISDVPKKGYRSITTSYSVLKTFDDNTSILDVNLHTGRTHQIRAHLAYIGYPIIGDGKYGNNAINKQFSKKFQELYSYKIKFCFSSDAGILNYLNDKEFCINTPLSRM